MPQSCSGRLDLSFFCMQFAGACNSSEDEMGEHSAIRIQAAGPLHP